MIRIWKVMSTSESRRQGTIWMPFCRHTKAHFFRTDEEKRISCVPKRSLRPVPTREGELMKRRVRCGIKLVLVLFRGPLQFFFAVYLFSPFVSSPSPNSSGRAPSDSSLGCISQGFATNLVLSLLTIIAICAIIMVSELGSVVHSEQAAIDALSSTY